jgi:hypothetical protein
MASYTEIEYMRVLNQTFYDQVKTADQKAGYICTFLTILFAYSKDRGQLLISLYSPLSFSWTWVLSLGFVAAASFAIVCTAMVIVPRAKAGGSTLYWGTWTAAAAFDKKLASGLPDEFVISESEHRDRHLLSRIAERPSLYPGHCSTARERQGGGVFSQDCHPLLLVDAVNRRKLVAPGPRPNRIIDRARIGVRAVGRLFGRHARI